MNYLKAFLLAILSAFLIASPAGAETAPQCSDLYNSPGSCETSSQFTVQKQIKNPKTGEFVDNLPLDQGSIQPGSTVTFRITITNTKGLLIENFNLSDVMPEVFTSIKPSKGEFNSANNTISYYLDKLEPNSSDSFDIEATVKNSDDLSKGKPLCLANIVTVAASYDEVVDNVQFCISGDNATGSSDISNADSGSAPTSSPQSNSSQPQTTKGGKQVASTSNATKSPSTGPELLALAALLPAAIGGQILRRKSNTN